jgi:acyl-coenzyme A thioesterase PaaI-like protein
MSSPGHTLLLLWNRLAPLPGGKRLFAWFLGRRVPYSGSIVPRVLSLEAGHARIELRDRRRVRNHLQSIHAVALANLGELTSGLAMTTALPADVRGIVVSLRMDYTKKARGTLVAEAQCDVPAISGDTQYDAIATIRDEAGDVVARAVVTWKLGISK